MHSGLLRSPPFLLFWTARVLSSLAYQMMSVVVGWQIYGLTGSTLFLGLAGLAQYLPMISLTLLAGHAADRYGRRNIVRACQAVAGCAVALMSIGSAFGVLHTEAIYAGVAAIGATRAFESPATAALLPTLVPTEQFARATALSASAMQTATIIGPAIGGALYIAGPAVAYGTIAALYLSASIMISLIRVLTPAIPKEPISLQSFLSGFSFVWSREILLGAISLDLFAVLLGGATALLPVYARDILHTGSVGLGVLRAAPAAGALTMSAMLARRPMRRNVGRRMFTAVIVFGLATIIFGLSTYFPLSLAALFVLGAADVVSVVIRSALVQLGTPNEMRGRVSAVNFMFIGTSNQFGEFESGVTASLFGTVPAVLIGGVGTILVAVTWMRLFPALLRADTLEGHRT